jgi:hypothetical protein
MYREEGKAKKEAKFGVHNLEEWCWEIGRT